MSKNQQQPAMDALKQLEQQLGMKFRRDAVGNYVRDAAGQYVLENGETVKVVSRSQTPTTSPEGWSKDKEKIFQSWLNEGMPGLAGVTGSASDGMNENLLRHVIDGATQAFEEEDLKHEAGLLCQEIHSAQEIDAIVELTAAFGRKCVERDWRVNSMVAVCPGRTGFRQMGAADNKQRKEVIDDAMNYLTQRKAQLAVLINDTWVGSPDWIGRPSEDPNRREALSVIAVTPDGKTVSTWFAVYKRVGGRIEWDKAVMDKNGQNFLRAWGTNERES